jgi:hypothetical protein
MDFKQYDKMKEKIIQIPASLMNPIPDYDSKLMRVFLEVYNSSKMDLFLEKDRQYGGSWQTDGYLSAYFNLKRKIDRVIQKFKNGTLWVFTSDSTGEANIDTFMDLENYSAMNAAFLFFTCKDLPTFEAFVQKVPLLDEYFHFNKVNKTVRIKSGVLEQLNVEPEKQPIFSEIDIEEQLIKKVDEGVLTKEQAYDKFLIFCKSRSKSIYNKNRKLKQDG